ncbi:MAG: carbohydrate kinase family protein [Candidatus Micrarchaeota archaeon]|nr:carbohydrate kinase family protein [Candidatus Micrarchaeota archaeon]
MSRLDVVCVGHLVYDIRDYVEHFPQPDKTVFLTRAPAVGAGGSAANAALNCRRLGHKSGLVSNVGDDLHGRFLISELRREGIDARQVKLVRGGRTALSIILIDKTGEVQVVEDIGCVEGHRPIPPAYLGQARWVHLTGCAPHWLEMASAAAEKAGKPISFDPGRAASRLGLAALDKVLGRTELLVLNRKELQALTGSSAYEEVRRLSRDYNCSVVLKQGHAPAVCCTSGRDLFEVKPFNAPQVVDTLGAGDAFDAGIICGRLEGRSLRESIVMGHACSAAKVMHAGAQSMPGRATIKKLFKF